MTQPADILLKTLKRQATIEVQDILRRLSGTERDRLIEAMESIDAILPEV